mmetsp:Transcript_7675/g.28275  ORF Transcript_7675/g.28275 Transcript_7675/m.28275 type:complete len:372 (+) Transcript_7675:1675-2790(+)
MKKVTDFSLPSYIEMYNATLDVSESERKACIIEAECILRGGKLSSAISSPAKLSTVIVYDESSAMTPAQSQLRYPYVARCLGDAKLMRLFIREVMRVVNDGGFAAALAMCADLDFIAGSLWTLFQIGGIAVIFLPLLFRRLCDDSCIGARSPSTLEAVCLFLSRGAVSSFSGGLLEFMYPVFYLRYGLLFVGRLVDGTGLGLVFSWGALVLMPPAHDKQPPNSIVSTFLRGVLMLINGNGKDTSGQPLTIEGPDMGTIMIPHLGFVVLPSLAWLCLNRALANTRRLREGKVLGLADRLQNLCLACVLAALAIYVVGTHLAICLKVLKSYSYEALLLSPGLGWHLVWWLLCMRVNGPGKPVEKRSNLHRKRD